MFTEEKIMTGKKIRYYRLKKGLTSEELAKAIGCTKASISLYENEDREPSDEILKKIASALDISWIQLLSRDMNNLKFEHVSFRKKQKASAKDIELLRIDIEKECANRIALLNILGELDKKQFKAKKLSFKDDPSENATKIRKMLDMPPLGPIYSVTNMLEDVGIIVLSFECSNEIDGINGTVNNIPYIFFNANIKTIERQRFTIVHETCHLFFDETNDCKEKEIEKYINRVAGNVLVPKEDIYQIFGKTNRNINVYLRNEISKKYKVAPSCLINRLYEEGVITEMYHKNFFIYLNRSYGRKSEPTLLDEYRDSERPTLFKHQVYLALSEELISASRAAEFLSIPLADVMNTLRME